jgi:hypothetical protein
MAYAEGRRGHGGWETHGALRRFLRWGAWYGRVIVVVEVAESSAQMSWSYNSSLRRLRRSRAPASPLRACPRLRDIDADSAHMELRLHETPAHLRRIANLRSLCKLLL